MESAHLSPYNTRLFKTGDTAFELRMASAKTGPYPGYEDPVTFEGVQWLGACYCCCAEQVRWELTRCS